MGEFNLPLIMAPLDTVVLKDEIDQNDIIIPYERFFVQLHDTS